MGEEDLFWIIYSIITITICGLLLIAMQIDSRRNGFKSFIHVILGKDHIHRWFYMYNPTYTYGWFYCPICLAHSKVSINVSGHVEIKVCERYNLLKQLRRRKR